MKNIKAFTLAEIMAVFTVIGILTAILLPAAMNSAPDQNVVRLKRAVGAFDDAVREMVNSEDYFFAGDLGKMPDETLIETKYTYVCSVLADIINPKSYSCGTPSSTPNHATTVSYTTTSGIGTAKASLDSTCKTFATTLNGCAANNCTVFEIKLHDNTQIFGLKLAYGKKTGSTRYFADPLATTTPYKSDELGFDSNHQVFCIDIDGYNKGEDPFGFGVRADGKMLFGARADSWINKSALASE